MSNFGVYGARCPDCGGVHHQLELCECTIKKLKERTHKGLSFVDAAGVLVRSYQLLDEEGKAVATADFYGDRCERAMFARTVPAFEAGFWVSHVRKIVEATHE